MSARIQITIDALNNATKELNQLKTELKDVGTAGQNSNAQTKTFGESLKEVGVQALAVYAGLMMAKKAVEAVYNIAKEGADIDYAASRFENWSEAIGTTAGALLGDMREATRGTKSDMELMAAATDVMSLGLVKNHDDAVRLATVMGGLNMNVDQLTLTLSNKTTKRFDTLGVSVDGFQERLDKLMETGMDEDSAFLEAFLQQAENSMKVSGHVADTIAGDFAKMEAASANFGGEFKRAIADDVQPAVGGLTGAFQFFADEMSMERKVRELTSQLQGLGIETEGYTAKMEDLQNIWGFTDDIEGYNELIAEMEEQIRIATEGTSDWADANYEGANSLALMAVAAGKTPEQLKAAINAMNDAALSMQGYSEALLFQAATADQPIEKQLELATAMGRVDTVTLEMVARLRELKTDLEKGVITWEEYTLGVVDLGIEMDELKNPITEVADATNSAAEAMKKYSDALLFAKASANMTEEEALGLAYAMGLVDAKTVAATEITKTLNGLWQSGALTTEQYYQAVGTLQTLLGDLAEGDYDFDVEAIVKYILDTLFPDGYEPPEKTQTVTTELDSSETDNYEPPNKTQFIFQKLIEPGGIDQNYSTGGYYEAAAAGKGTTSSSQYRWQEYGYGGEAFVSSSSGYILSRSDAAAAVSSGSGIDEDKLAQAIMLGFERALVRAGGLGTTNNYNLNGVGDDKIPSAYEIFGE